MSKKIIIWLYFLLIINFIYVLSGVLHIPMQSVDVVGIWLFKAKAVFIEQGIPWQTLNNPDFLLFHPQYPLLLPLIYGGFYLLVGRVWELPILLLYPLFYLLTLRLVYLVLRKMDLTKLQTLVYVYIYSMFSPLLGQAGRMHAGSADILIILIAWWVIYLWQTWTNKSMWLITVLVMLASQIKSEGLFIGAIILFFPITKYKKIGLLGLAVLPTLIWNCIVKMAYLPVDFSFMTPNLTTLIYRSVLIIFCLVQEMLNIKNWYFFWLLFWLAVLNGNWSKKKSYILNIGLILILVSSAYAGVYLTVTTEIYGHITSSIDRVLLHLSPYFYPVFVYQSQYVLRKILVNRVK